jgi:hypothetical protein
MVGRSFDQARRPRTLGLSGLCAGDGPPHFPACGPIGWSVLLDPLPAAPR